MNWFLWSELARDDAVDRGQFVVASRIIEAEVDGQVGNSSQLLEMQGKSVGYATIGRNRVKTLPFDGEVYELYLMPEYQGIGAGSHLFLAAMGELKRRGLSGAVVWVLADNDPAIRFYENAGGRQVAEGRETFDDQDLKKIAFAWG